VAHSLDRQRHPHQLERSRHFGFQFCSNVLFTCLAVASIACPSIAYAGPESAVTLSLRDGRPIVDGVYVNGHGPYRFLVDTGSTLNHLDPKLAASIGLPVTFHTNLTSSTGVAPASSSEGTEIRLGPAGADQQVFLFAGIEACMRSHLTSRVCSVRFFCRASITCSTCAATGWSSARARSRDAEPGFRSEM